MFEIKSGTRGGATVLERPADAITEPEKSEGANLGTLKSSLTVIENPSLDGRLGILMAENTIIHEY